MKKNNKFLFFHLILLGFILFITGSCKKDEMVSSTVTDIDGNVYNVVVIGTQIWMQENLKTTRYNDGTPIINITDTTAWTTAGPAYCWYSNDAATYKETYGALYNWYAVDPESNGNKNLCPEGWHVPADAEWKTLVNYLGGEMAAGGKLKENGAAHWMSPNTGADNSSGFTALPGGFSNFPDGSFVEIRRAGCWWSATDGDALSATDWGLYYLDNIAYRLYSRKSCGFSVRCVRNGLLR
jgi:uncharacterized protein (TIGR02145 family)